MRATFPLVWSIALHAGASSISVKLSRSEYIWPSLASARRSVLHHFADGEDVACFLPQRDRASDASSFSPFVR